MSGNRCRYCAAPIPDLDGDEPVWRREEVWRTRPEILTSTDLWAPDETLPLIGRELAAGWSRVAQRKVRVRVDARQPAEFCSDAHRKAASGNREARAAAVDECRDDERPEPMPYDPNQGAMFE